MERSILVVIGAGQIGLAIARRVGVGKHVLLADYYEKNVQDAAEVLRGVGFRVTTSLVDIAVREDVVRLAREAASLGNVTGLVLAAGVSPSQAEIEKILRVDLYGTALVLDVFRPLMSAGGAAVVISSQSGHRLPALSQAENDALATTEVESLLALPFLQKAQIQNTLHAYQLAKRANVLRVMAEAVLWGKQGARVNAISPGIIMTPLAQDELSGPRGAVYRRMIELSPAGRVGTADEVAQVAALLMGSDGTFISGSDFLMDGGVTAAFWYGELGQ